ECMFDICFSTPSVMNEDGIPQAGAQLRLGNDIFVFTIDLSHWSNPEYVQHMWAFWREEKSLYIQQHAVINRELDHPFVPRNPYAYVGARIDASKYELPIPEWRVNLADIF